MLSLVQLFVGPWTVAWHAPLPMGLPRQEYWSGLPFPPPGDLLNPGIEPVSLASPESADSSPLCALAAQLCIPHQTRTKDSSPAVYLGLCYLVRDPVAHKIYIK